MPAAAPLRVLVADDSSLLRRLLRDAIEEVEGVEVVAEAPDGITAVVEARKHSPGVVVLDLQMPVINGLTALPLILSRPPRPCVIVLTNHAGAAYRDACLAAGADHFFDKSSEVDRVLDVLRQLAVEAGAQA